MGQAPDRRCVVVGIGSATSGWATLEGFVASVPEASGLAYVVVAPPDGPALGNLVKILAGHTRLPVSPLRDVSDLEPNHIYVQSPGADLIVRGGVLHLNGAARACPDTPGKDEVPATRAHLPLEVTALRHLSTALLNFHMDLEARVAERTHRLAATNAGLRAQVVAQARLEAEVARRVEAERVRVGMELHDNLCQQLAATAMLAARLRKRLGGREPALAEMAGRIVATLHSAGADAHKMARGVRPVEIEPAGLMIALAALVQQTQDMQGVRCRFACAGTVLLQSTAAATHLFRIGQEAIHNAISHGHAKHIVVALTDSPTVSLTIHDDGVGIAAPEQRPPGRGLQIMAYRARVIGASLRVVRGDAGGTLVECVLAPGGDPS